MTDSDDVPLYIFLGGAFVPQGKIDVTVKPKANFDDNNYKLIEFKMVLIRKK